MKKNKSLVKIDAHAGLLTKKADLALRGISDFKKMDELKKLREEMVGYYKAGRFSECDKVCKKIISLGGGSNPLVKLIHNASKNRLGKKR